MKKKTKALIGFLIGSTIIGCSSDEKTYNGLITNKYGFYSGDSLKYTGTEVKRDSIDSKIFVVSFDPSWEAGTNWNGNVGIRENLFKDALSEDLSEILDGIDSVRTFKGKGVYGLDGGPNKTNSTIYPSEFSEFSKWADGKVKIRK